MPVRVDIGRLILEWVMIVLVALALAVVIGFTGAGVKASVPRNFNAWSKSYEAPPPALAKVVGSEQEQYQQYVQYVRSLSPDDTVQKRYLFACFLFGVVALLLTGLYPPWLGRPQENAEKLSANRPMLIPAGYAWLWHSYRVPARLPAKQAEK
ncbi:MAG: hypothetical protein ACRD11_12490 [Terriglobia bacterium]